MVIDNINTDIQFKENISYLRDKLFHTKININGILADYNTKMFRNNKDVIIQENYLLIRHTLNSNRELLWLKFNKNSTIKGKFNKNEKIKFLIMKGICIDNLNNNNYSNYSSFTINSNSEYNLTFHRKSIVFVELKDVTFDNLVIE